MAILKFEPCITTGFEAKQGVVPVSNIGNGFSDDVGHNEFQSAGWYLKVATRVGLD